MIRCRRVRPPGEDRGTSVVELVITMPLLLFAILLIVQVGLWQHARHVALAAAREGARVARKYQGSAAAGRAAADEYVAGLAPRLLRDRTITADRTPTETTVRVTGHVLVLVPGLAVTVSELSTGPTERFVPDK